MQIASKTIVVSRSLKPKRRKTNKTVLVQTHVTPEVARKLEEKLRAMGDISQASYVRTLILKDLGQIEETANG